MVERLSPRELAVLRGIVGRRNGEIAADLGISPETVKNHLSNAYVKLGCDGVSDPRTLAVAMMVSQERAKAAELREERE